MSNSNTGHGCRPPTRASSPHSSNAGAISDEGEGARPVSKLASPGRAEAIGGERAEATGPAAAAAPFSALSSLIHEERSDTLCQIRTYDEKSDEITDELNKRGIGHLPHRLERYGAAVSRTRVQGQFTLELVQGGDDDGRRRELERMADKLNRCGSYLGFRHYFTIDELRLHEGYFCQFEKLCQLCALRRSAKLLRTYSEKFAQVMREQPHLVACMVTFTVKDGPELSERLNHLLTFHGVQLERRKKRLRDASRPETEWARAAGGVSRVEIKRGSGSGQWHPHIHAGWLCDQLPDQDKLRDEWHELTGDSHQVKVSPCRFAAGAAPIDIAGELVEILKYAVKLSDTSPADALHVHETTRGKKLIRPFGLLHGVKLSDGCLDDPLCATDLPFIELFFNYEAGGYRSWRRQSA